MLANYGSVALFILAAISFAFIMILLPVIFRFMGIVPHKPNPVKVDTYECGMETVGRTWVQFNFRYYFFALLFVAFDVLAVFLYPWAVKLRTLAAPSVAVIFTFIFIIFVGYVYAWRKKVSLASGSILTFPPEIEHRALVEILTVFRELKLC